MAVEHAKGRLKTGEEIVNEGLLGIKFTGKLTEEIANSHGHKAVVPVVGGQSDPFPEGFTIGDIW